MSALADTVPLFWKNLYDSNSKSTKNEHVWKAIAGWDISPAKFNKPAPGTAPARPLIIPP